MGFWYSKNAKLCMRSEQGYYYYSSNKYYGYVHNGENFKATDGTTGTYLYSSSYDSSSSMAILRASNLCYLFLAIPSSASNIHVCLDNNAWDDTRYSYSGEVSGITKSIASSFPGSTVVTLTNSTDASLTFNSLVWADYGYLSNASNSQGTASMMLRYAYIFDSPITLEAGQTITVSLTT